MSFFLHTLSVAIHRKLTCMVLVHVVTTYFVKYIAYICMLYWHVFSQKIVVLFRFQHFVIISVCRRMGLVVHSNVLHPCNFVNHPCLTFTLLFQTCMIVYVIFVKFQHLILLLIFCLLILFIEGNF